MKTIKLRVLVAGLAFALLSFTAQAQHANHTNPTTPKSGKPVILRLAHGGSKDWNNEVNKLVQETDKTFPPEVAFRMATKSNMEAAIHRLVTRGVSEIIAVPLFISPHSSVVTSSQYLLGLRAESPADLAKFAKMNHGHGGENHSAHNSDPTKPIELPALLRMTDALSRHPLVAQILRARAKHQSKAC